MTKNYGPWKIKKSVQKYKNPWLEVYEDQVIRPDGKPGVFGVVKIRPGASVLPLDNDEFVYLTEEFRYAIGQNSIEVVSGGINSGEKPISAAKRELREELGITADEWIDLGLVNPFTSTVYSPVNMFIAKGLKFGQAKREGTELIRTIKVSLNETVKMVMDSKITHAQSCVLILKAARYLKDKNKVKKIL